MQLGRGRKLKPREVANVREKSDKPDGCWVNKRWIFCLKFRHRRDKTDKGPNNYLVFFRQWQPLNTLCPSSTRLLDRVLGADAIFHRPDLRLSKVSQQPHRCSFSSNFFHRCSSCRVLVGERRKQEPSRSNLRFCDVVVTSPRRSW